MDNKGHFHFELSFKGYVNKKVLPAPLHMVNSKDLWVGPLDSSIGHRDFLLL